MENQQNFTQEIFAEALNCWVPILSQSTKQVTKIEHIYSEMTIKVKAYEELFNTLSSDTPNAISIRVYVGIAKSAVLFVNHKLDECIVELKKAALTAKSIDFKVYSTINFLLKIVVDL